ERRARTPTSRDRRRPADRGAARAYGNVEQPREDPSLKRVEAVDLDAHGSSRSRHVDGDRHASASAHLLGRERERRHGDLAHREREAVRAAAPAAGTNEREVVAGSELLPKRRRTATAADAGEPASALAEQEDVELRAVAEREPDLASAHDVE